MANRATILKQQFQNSLALPLEQVLPEAVIEAVLQTQGVRYRQTLYSPIVVLWAWLSQVLDADKSLNNAVKRGIAWIAATSVEKPSADTGGYSKARTRFPLAVLPPLLKQTATALTVQIKPEQQWCGRRVKAYDGTSVLMSDTPANQQVYPQHSNQKAGCGFPIAKLVVWFCVTTGVVLEVAIAAFNTSEWQLSRQLYATLNPKDVVAGSALPEFISAIEKTRCKNLVTTGLATDFGLCLPTVSAAKAGYQVYGIVDVSGILNIRIEQAAWMRMMQAGVILTSWTAFTGEI
ncbi:isochorismatase family protein [Leptolyngbya ohadii]|uniref:isochorismatase family protein n=1 Tax=Leptolyngbya ohadii TaxID=1962290 RepID=UPI000B598B2B|nr:isochorismatase family protein [Leptolyngbya ohadii]